MTFRYLAEKLSLINIRLFVIKHVNVNQYIKLFLIHSKAEWKDKTINPWELPCCLFSKLVLYCMNRYRYRYRYWCFTVSGTQYTTTSQSQQVMCLTGDWLVVIYNCFDWLEWSASQRQKEQYSNWRRDKGGGKRRVQWLIAGCLQLAPPCFI